MTDTNTHWREIAVLVIGSVIATIVGNIAWKFVQHQKALATQPETPPAKIATPATPALPQTQTRLQPAF